MKNEISLKTIIDLAPLMNNYLPDGISKTKMALSLIQDMVKMQSADENGKHFAPKIDLNHFANNSKNIDIVDFVNLKLSGTAQMYLAQCYISVLGIISKCGRTPEDVKMYIEEFYNNQDIQDMISETESYSIFEIKKMVMDSIVNIFPPMSYWNNPECETLFMVLDTFADKLNTDMEPIVRIVARYYETTKNWDFDFRSNLN